MVPKNNKVILIEAESETLQPLMSEKARVEWKIMEDKTIEVEDPPQSVGRICKPNKTSTVLNVKLIGFVLIKTSIRINDAGNDYNFAMTGKTFAVLKQHFPDILRKSLLNGTIFVSLHVVSFLTLDKLKLRTPLHFAGTHEPGPEGPADRAVHRHRLLCVDVW